MRLWQCLTQYGAAIRTLVYGGEQQALSAPYFPDFAFSENWSVLGPFQIGTREAAWSADPLQYHGGFHTLKYDPETIFKSSLAINGKVAWKNFTAILSKPSIEHAKADLSISFPDVDLDFLEDVYGWPARQWQGWARGELYVQSKGTKHLALYTRGIVECYVDGVHYFGGDFYNYGRAPVTLHLEPGVHTIDIRLYRDVRALGGVGEPSVDVQLELKLTGRYLRPSYDYGDEILMADAIIDNDSGTFASPYASVTVRNDAEKDMYVYAIDGMEENCVMELLSKDPIKLVPGQTRPIGFKIACIPSWATCLNLEIKYRYEDDDTVQAIGVATCPNVIEPRYQPHKITFLHPAGMVSYAILRPPSPTADCGKDQSQSLPVLIALHGANVDADSDQVRSAFDPLPDLCAWVLFPTGVTPWSGDDWHNWGLADVEAAVAAIPDWIEHVEWQGPGVDINKWLVTGHSNGGQGTWFVLTHRPDKIIAAAALSGFSSLENYVPDTFWRTADPGRTGVMQAAMESYRHELVLENAKGVPIFQQHGTLDDNVPAYHSRLLSLRLEQAGVDTTYVEVPGQGHYWDGVMTTAPLSAFFKRQLNQSIDPTHALRDFSIVTANPANMGSKYGLELMQLVVPNQLGRIDVSVDPMTAVCTLRTSNVLSFWMPVPFGECNVVLVDNQEIPTFDQATHGGTFIRHANAWRQTSEETSVAPLWPVRRGKQLGAMTAILHTNAAFVIVRHSARAEHTALQISRNLCQYYAADTIITDNFTEAISSKGNVVSVAIGNTLPVGLRRSHPIEIRSDKIIVHEGFGHDGRDSSRSYTSIPGMGLAAIFLRPMPDERLELVVWGVDEASLDIAARLVPMITGSGEPDFVIADRRMLWKGVEGTLAMGFFDSYWEVSRNSYLS